MAKQKKQNGKQTKQNGQHGVFNSPKTTQIETKNRCDGTDANRGVTKRECKRYGLCQNKVTTKNKSSQKKLKLEHQKTYPRGWGAAEVSPTVLQKY